MYLVPVSRSARHFDRFVDDALDRFFTAPAGGAAATATRSPALDVTETDTAYTVQLDMPGLTREAIKVSIEHRKVSVSGQATPQAAGADTAEAVRVLYRERQPVAFARSFTLAGEIDQDASQAKYEHGVLTLTLAKRKAATSTLTIN